MDGSQTITVAAPSASYTVEISRGATRRLAELMASAGVRPTAAALLCDRAVEAGPAADAERSLEAAGIRTVRIPVPAEEQGKSLAALGDACGRMLDAGLDRGSAVVAVGGGIVGDLAGFAAATYMRGVSCVQVPTTLLAMVDASVGGKSAVNLVRPDGSLAKNILGSIVQPRLVVCDPESLGTLPVREVRGGLAECVKHAVIADPPMLAWLEARMEPILARDPGTMAELVARNVRVKAEVVGADEYERGRRAELNLGHTFAHAIESVLHGECSHGEAVAIGMVAACRLATETGLGSCGAEVAVCRALESAGLPIALPRPVDAARLRAAMDADKKRQGGALRLVAPMALGVVRVVSGVPEAAILAAWRAVGAA